VSKILCDFFVFMYFTVAVLLFLSMKLNRIKSNHIRTSDDSIFAASWLSAYNILSRTAVRVSGGASDRTSPQDPNLLLSPVTLQPGGSLTCIFTYIHCFEHFLVKSSLISVARYFKYMYLKYYLKYFACTCTCILSTFILK